jgi:hypothetical protein
MAEKRASRHPKDFNEVAFNVVQIATGQAPKPEPPKPKNPAAVTLGRLGGLKGGAARKAALSPEQRKAIAKKAAEARWKNQ